MKTKKNITLKKLLFLIPFIFLLNFCDSGDPVSVNKTEPKMEYGTTKTYKILSNPNYELIEEITGYKFSFPNGGSGDLTVKEIIDGPEPTIKPIKWFAVSYGGDDTLLITIPHKKDDYDFLCIYSIITGASLTNISPEKKIWHSISNYIETDSTITFIIPHQLVNRTKNKKEGFQTIPETDFAFVKILPNSSRAEIINLVKQTVKQNVDYIGTFLSDDVRLTYNNRYKLLKLTWAYASDREGSYFSFGTSWFGYYGVFGFEYTPNMTTRVIHHEAGHLINYLLYGVVDYEALWSKFGDKEHVFLTPLLNGREQGLQEDIAYILENYIADVNSTDVDLTANETSIWTKINNGQQESKTKYTAHPQYIDFPAIEGFAAALVHQLTAKNTQMYTFDCVNAAVYYKRILRTPAPVLNISIQDVFCYILLRNPQTVNELMQYILDYLSSQSPDLLPKFLVRAEAMGWSYYGKVKIVDNQGKALPNAEVLPVMQAGISTRDFWTVSSFKTDNKGECIVPRLYPGSQILRVFYNYQSGKFSDSTDFPFTPDWTKPTNVQLDLGTLKVESSDYQTINIEHEFNTDFLDGGTTLTDTIFSKLNISGKLIYPKKCSYEFNNKGEGEIDLIIFIDKDYKEYDSIKIELLCKSSLNKYSAKTSTVDPPYNVYELYTFENKPNYQFFWYDMISYSKILDDGSLSLDLVADFEYITIYGLIDCKINTNYKYLWQLFNRDEIIMDETRDKDFVRLYIQCKLKE